MSPRILAAIFPLLALSLVVSSTSAGGTLNLAWNSCSGDGGARNQDFACNSNVQAFTLVGSFGVSSAVPQMTGIIGRLEVSTGGPFATQPWWSSFGTSACRPGALSVDATPPVGASNCLNPWTGTATSGIAIGFVPDGYWAEGITFDASLPAGQTQALAPGVEYFAFRLNIRTDKTVGAGACGGCNVPACIAWRDLQINQPTIPGGPPTAIYIGGGEYLATWQSASLNGTACASVTPIRNHTWGTIKSLYR